MYNFNTILLGSAKDKVQESNILKALNTSESQDFIFVVSVQPNGKYPSIKPSTKLKKLL